MEEQLDNTSAGSEANEATNQLPENLQKIQDNFINNVEKIVEKIEASEASKPAYVPKYTIKKKEETVGFQFKELSYREVVFEDMIAAQRISGESEGNQFNLAIVAQTCEFDGKKATYEDLQKLKWADFLELRSLLTDCDWMGSAEQLSYSLGKLGLI